MDARKTSDYAKEAYREGQILYNSRGDRIRLE